MVFAKITLQILAIMTPMGVVSIGRRHFSNSSLRQTHLTVLCSSCTADEQLVTSTSYSQKISDIKETSYFPKLVLYVAISSGSENSLLSVPLSRFLSIYLHTYLFVCLSFYSSTYLTISLSVPWSEGKQYHIPSMLIRSNSTDRLSSSLLSAHSRDGQRCSLIDCHRLHFCL